MPGPLKGIKILEIAGIGPGPFCAMMLADNGAEVVRIDRASGHGGGVVGDPRKDILNRGRRSIAVNLKSAEGVATVLDMVAQADGLIEGFRPGVMEKLGLGPDVCFARNPKLVYGRMTGWGQDGPMANAVGHDINYISLAGALHAYGRAGEKPVPPINMVGDFGGGGMLLAFGMVTALLEAHRSGQGQVIDAAMIDGAASLMAMIWAFKGMGIWRDERGVNILDTGAHFYDVYETSDGKFMSLGAIEPQFYADFLRRVGLAEDAELAHEQMLMPKWPAFKEKLTAVFKTKTRDEWAAILEGTDACAAPVLSLSEAPHHPHIKARGTLVEVNGIMQPAPSPRFSRTANDGPGLVAMPGEHGAEILSDWGFAADRIAALKASGAIG
jgi:alpha-methylacyl-CoA racemase